MKKILSLLILIGISVLSSQTINAHVENGLLPVGKNYLQLNTLTKNDESFFAYSKDVIYVTPNDTYTLVMSYDYVGNYANDILKYEFEIELADNYRPYTYDVIDDPIHQLYYTEFNPVDNFIIFRIPYLVDVNGNNYEIMIYKGTYDEFDGFEPYLHKAYEPVQYGELVVDINDKMTTSEIEEYILAFNSDGKEIEYEIVKDEYSEGSNVPGTYEVTFLTSSNNINKQLTLNVFLKDFDAPIIEGPNTLRYGYSERGTLQEILSIFEITDNVDELTVEDMYIIGKEIDDMLEIGVYNLELSVSDSSGNETKKNVEIEIFDDEGPAISGPDSLIVYTTDDPLSTTDILSKFKANDEVDGKVTLFVKQDEYKQNQLTGVYQMILEASDSSGNTVEKTINIHVVDNQGPSFVVLDPIVITTNELLSTTDIDVMLKNKIQQIDSEIKNVNIISNEYEEHKDNPGLYYVYYKYDYQGEEYISRVQIEVKEGIEIIEYWYVGILVIPIGIIVYLFVLNKKKKIARKKD